MKISELAGKDDFIVVSGAEGLDGEIKGVYIGDLLSWVMSNAKEGAAWITIQGHVNIMAVASLTGVSCVIVAEGAEISAEAISKSDSEAIPILTTKQSAFETAKLLMSLGF